MNIKIRFAVGMTLAASAAFAATPQIAQENVSLSQGISRLITINYTLEDAPGIVTADIQTNRGDGVYCSIGGQYLCNMYGDVNAYQQTGAHQIHWQPDQAWPNHKLSVVEGGVRAVVTAWATNCPPPFATVDLVVTGDVRFYPSAEALPGGITDSRYKTDLLLLRKIPAAGVRWRMGSPTGESGRSAAYETPRYVTLSQDFYMGVYMVTQKQYWHLNVPSIISTEKGHRLPANCMDTDSADSAMHPVSGVYPNLLRGACGAGADQDWPNTTPKHKVAAASVLAGFRTAAGQAIEFDLPTSSQWEFACRAGTGTAYNNGTDTNINEVAWYSGNAHYNDPATAEDESKTRDWAVGLKKPNAFDLYDMHGLHWEWCLDWHARHESGAEEFDPEGPTTASTRVARGGGHRSDDAASDTRSAAIGNQAVTYGHSRYGMRLCAPAIYFAPAE